ncbi:MAG: gliding motility-associated ABC transporter substrate-binding protein GldG [Ferruginibacter sp.]
MKGNNTFLNRTAVILLTLVVLLLVNIAAAVWHTRVDLTKEKRFTLSQPTHQLLKNLDAPVQVDVFLKGNYPSGFKQLAASTSDILQAFKEIAGNKIKFRFLSPDEPIEGTNVLYADTLSAMGIYPINLTSQVQEGQQQQFVFPVAVLHYGEKMMPVTLYQGKTPLINYQELNSAEALLEYYLANGIAKITTTLKPLVGYATGNGQPMGYNVYDLVENTLKADYNLATFNLAAQPLIPPDFKALIIVKPTSPFTEVEKLKLDQYVMNGGKLFLLLDRLNAEMDSLQIKNEVIAYDRNLGITDLLFKYGVRINPDLVMDLQCDFLPFDVNGNGQFELLPWNYFPLLQSPSNHPINKNLGFVAGRFINSIDTITAEGISKIILLSSSVNARTIATPALVSPRENVTAPEDEKFNKPNIPVAVLLEGAFQSFYANRLSQILRDTLLAAGSTFKPNGVNNKMIVVADGDIVLNGVVKGNQPLPMGMNQYTYGTQQEFPFANKAFFQNCLDYLVSENNLSEAKSKDYVARLLNGRKVKDERTKWQLINIAVPVILVILFATVFQWLRRRKYAV